ncbi:MAG TPA: hypothetical protein VFT87_04090 [Candidatus Saccharimonadales bacterium]|nr:hypothetical protein [Candidatus Saccharimonadales bacterium]
MNEYLLGFLAVALVVALLLFFFVAKFARKAPGLNKAHYEDQWLRIERLAAGSQGEVHLAVLEADKLLDHALKARGFGGQTMGDRLKRARNSFRNNNGVWQAHKLRNRLAHESGITIGSGEVSSALAGFKAGLRDLGAL